MIEFLVPGFVPSAASRNCFGDNRLEKMFASVYNG